MHGDLYKQKTLEKLFSLVRYILLAGLCFIIIYPFIIKFTSIFMSQEDLADDTVFYLSRNPLHSSCAFQPLMKQYVGVFEKVSVDV